MRRQLLAELPQFSAYFGIHPWDIDQLTLREISEYRTFLQRMASQQGG